MKGVLLPLVWLAAAAAGFWLLVQVEHLVLVALAALFIVAPVWYLLTSALSSAEPDRTCPSCRRESLEAIDPALPVGIRCPLCGFVDEDAPTAPLDLDGNGRQPLDRGGSER